MLTVAHGLSSTPNYNLNSPQKVNVLTCRAALFTIRDCYYETITAYTTRQVRIFLRPNCCKAALALDSGCWPNMFGLSLDPLFPPFLRFYCSRFSNGQPLIPPFGATRAAEGLEGNRNKESASDSNGISATPSKGV